MCSNARIRSPLLMTRAVISLSYALRSILETERSGRAVIRFVPGPNSLNLVMSGISFPLPSRETTFAADGNLPPLLVGSPGYLLSSEAMRLVWISRSDRIDNSLSPGLGQHTSCSPVKYAEPSQQSFSYRTPPRLGPFADSGTDWIYPISRGHRCGGNS